MTIRVNPGALVCRSASRAVRPASRILVGWTPIRKLATDLDALRATGFHGSRFAETEWTRKVVADTRKSKLLRDTSLPQDRVGGVPGQDFRVHGETSLRDRTVPDFVVAFARPLEATSTRAENVLHTRSVTSHQKVRTPRSSCSYSTWKLAVRSLVARFNSNNSGIRVLSF